LEDVVEELVGEITDEHDTADPRATRQRDETWLLPGDLRPDQIADICGVSLPESKAYETVAGLVIARLGRMPESADTVEVQATMVANTSLGVLTARVHGSADDVPRVVLIRLTVAARARRRIETVVLSAVGPIEDHGELR
jgi:CBS domain containing-hemolysin-like protein